MFSSQIRDNLQAYQTLVYENISAVSDAHYSVARLIKLKREIMFCPNCGAENKEGAKFCVQCGTKLNQEPEAAPKPAETAYRATSSTSTTSQPIQKASAKNPVVAAILSFVIAGVGQMYNGEMKKGLLMLGGTIILGALTGGILAIAIWLWAIYDAYTVAKEMA